MDSDIATVCGKPTVMQTPVKLLRGMPQASVQWLCQTLGFVCEYDIDKKLIQIWRGK